MMNAVATGTMPAGVSVPIPPNFNREQAQQMYQVYTRSLFQACAAFTEEEKAYKLTPKIFITQ